MGQQQQFLIISIGFSWGLSTIYLKDSNIYFNFISLISSNDVENHFSSFIHRFAFDTCFLFVAKVGGSWKIEQIYFDNTSCTTTTLNSYLVDGA